MLTKPICEPARTNHLIAIQQEGALLAAGEPQRLAAAAAKLDKLPPQRWDEMVPEPE